MSNRTDLERRTFLRVGCAGLAGLALPYGMQRMIAAEKTKANADAVLFINLLGGPSHLDTLDMKPEGPADTKGDFAPIQTSIPGLIACEYMPKFAKRANEYALIRGISHSTGDHPQGQEYISTGNRPTPALRHPSLGSIVSREFPGSGEIPPYVIVPRSDWQAGFMGDAYSPFKTNDYPKHGEPFEVRGISLPEGLTVSKVKRRTQLLKSLDTRFTDSGNNEQLQKSLGTLGEQAETMILSPNTRDAFDISKEPESIQSMFEPDDVGQGLLLATRLIEFGVPFVSVSHFGWDTHTNNFSGHRALIPVLDNGLDAATEALKQKGLLDRTLVVAMGEFGRTPKINQNVGRDHYPRANWCIMTGAGIQQGLLLGGTNEGGTAPDDSTDISPDDIAATILQSVGIDHHSTYYTATGRPVDLIPNGRVLEVRS